ncbi:hypothetical protein B0H21DRAFT_28271 [Amylocystis lapponica]|nr:hypothetical protein B0H21DRAFT_28271 [Amylocystis lapponica]
MHDTDDDWDAFLKDHPIFSPTSGTGRDQVELELSLSSLPKFTDLDLANDAPTPSGRRQVMVIKDTDLVVAAGSEIRMTSLNDFKLGHTTRKSYKILHTPNIQFEIHQMALNPNGKLLAVAGAFQVAVVVLPRAGFTRLVPTTVDCKSLQVGQFYHAADTSPPVVKIDWHPWGDGGSTLLVMTTDGKLREYDISEDAQEPQQVLSFVPEKKRNTFLAEDASEREVASFTFGKGRADWGPLSIYAVMKSGDIYAICPYMPINAAIPSSYVHALECFVAAKQEFLSDSQRKGSSSSSLSALYDYQHKYVAALIKQLPPGTVFPAIPRLVSMHPPNTIKNPPLRQGPFLLQPSPRSLVDSEGGDATDIVYLAFSHERGEESEGETERLGVMLVAFQDGKVDVYLDVEKVEARWEHKQHPTGELPMLAVYETIDLGIVSNLLKVTTQKSSSSLLELLRGNHPVFLPDPIQDDIVYVYHAFGVHALQLGRLLRNLAAALRENTDGEEQIESPLDVALQDSRGTNVQPILTTFSIERKCSSPIVGLSVPNDVHLTYSIFVLTSAMRSSVFSLNLRSDSPYSSTSELPSSEEPSFSLSHSHSPSKSPPATAGPPAYVSLLGTEPFTPPPVLNRASGLPSNPRLSLPPAPSPKGDFQLTPDTLRYLGTTVERFMGQIHEVQLAHRAAQARSELQHQEFARQREKCREMLESIAQLTGTRQAQTRERVERLQEGQQALAARLERIMPALMAKASPELSEHETRWFEELRRMREEVVGAGKYDERSLVARAKLLRRETDRLLPSLKEMKEKELARSKRLSERVESLGVSQAFELGKRSNEERAKISKLQNQALKLAARLDMSLGRPPELGQSSKP